MNNLLEWKLIIYAILSNNFIYLDLNLFYVDLKNYLLFIISRLYMWMFTGNTYCSDYVTI